MLCTNCRRREAKYLRAASGETLCGKCLANGVYKQLRKFFTLYNVLKRGSSTIYIIRIDRIPESLAILRVLNRLLGNLSTRRIMLVPKGLRAVNLGQLVPLDVAEIAYYEVPSELSSMAELIKALDTVAKNACMMFNASVALVPLFRDELTLLMIQGLLDSAPHIFSDALPVKRGSGVCIARPTYYVFSADAVAIAYLSRLYELIPPETAKLPSLNARERVVVKHMYPILWRSRELMYSSRKSLELLQSFILAKTNRCSICLARSSEDPCPLCRELMTKFSKIYIEPPANTHRVPWYGDVRRSSAHTEGGNQ